MATTELSADTRARILEAAWRRVREHGTGAVSVKAIAAGRRACRASSSTSTSATAPGLLLAMARHRDRASGFPSRVAAARELPPVDGLEALLRAWCAYLPEHAARRPARSRPRWSPATRAARSGSTAWATSTRSSPARARARRPSDGRLAPGWTADTAADWAWARVQPSSWEHLVGRRGWSGAEYTERTVARAARRARRPLGQQPDELLAVRGGERLCRHLARDREHPLGEAGPREHVGGQRQAVA